MIDRDQRQEAIAEAVWRIILRSGVSAVSVRDVAAEADIAVGSVRHVFANKEEILIFAMELAHRRVEQRVAKHLGVTNPVALARGLLSELLPLDDTRRVEMEVNLALVAEAPAHPRLRELATAAQAAVRRACVGTLTHLRETGLVHADRDLDREASYLHALLDGLALHLVVDPTERTPNAVALIDRHLETLRHQPNPPETT